MILPKLFRQEVGFVSWFYWALIPKIMEDVFYVAWPFLSCWVLCCLKVNSCPLYLLLKYSRFHLLFNSVGGEHIWLKEKVYLAFAYDMCFTLLMWVFLVADWMEKFLRRIENSETLSVVESRIEFKFCTQKAKRNCQQALESSYSVKFLHEFSIFVNQLMQN